MPPKSILLVDDEEIIRKAIGLDLRREGYALSTAGSAEEAIALLEDHSFALVITDLAMSGMDGLQVLKEVKRRSSLTGVIILTGYGDMDSVIEALRLGADDYLLKPCDSEELIIRIERCLEKQRMAELFSLQNRKLAESELHKTLLLNSASDGIYGLDVHGRTTFINAAAEKMLGYSAGEIVGKISHPLVHHSRKDGTPYPDEECLMMVAIKKQRKIFVSDEVFWRKDGTSFPVEYSSTPIQHEEAVVGAVVLFSDITEKKAREKQLRQTEKHLQQLEKYQSLNAMAAGIAHNFNNILMAVLGNQELALESMPAGQKEREYIEAAFLASQRAAKISTMMLQFVGQVQIDMQQFAAAELLQEMLEILQPQLSTQIELCSEGTEEVFLKADKSMVQQIIANLVTNAAEAIGEEKGTITLRCGRKFYTKKELRQPHTQLKLPAGEYVFLSVTDTGPGMSKEVLRRAFEPFFTTKFTGRGMGLATIIGIMRTHRGTIVLENNENNHGKGVTVSVLFPALVPQILPMDQTPKVVPVAEKFAGTVLLVDDERIVRELGKEILTQMGFEVLLAADGQEGLDLFEKNVNGINLVLLDIAMPRLDGVGVLNRIREKSAVPVIMATGYSLEQVAAQFEKIANVGLIQKPYSQQELREKIRQAFSH